MGTSFHDASLEIDAAEIVGRKPIVCEPLIKIDHPVFMPSNQPNKKNPIFFLVNLLFL